MYSSHAELSAEIMNLHTTVHRANLAQISIASLLKDRDQAQALLPLMYSLLETDDQFRAPVSEFAAVGDVNVGSTDLVTRDKRERSPQDTNDEDATAIQVSQQSRGTNQQGSGTWRHGRNKCRGFSPPVDSPCSGSGSLEGTPGDFVFVGPQVCSAGTAYEAL